MRGMDLHFPVHSLVSNVKNGRIVYGNGLDRSVIIYKEAIKSTGGFLPMKKREGDRRNPWSRRLGERRQNNLPVDNEQRKDEDRRKIDQRTYIRDRDNRN